MTPRSLLLFDGACCGGPITEEDLQVSDAVGGTRHHEDALTKNDVHRVPLAGLALHLFVPHLRHHRHRTHAGSVGTDAAGDVHRSAFEAPAFGR
ncbi:hypothetical protein EYF80_049302 [Liparis tanakae]|uniref:Uncharacterized protein n=1 Tax=Liparis tanakae TaxID=230148 RepID=A0A4Z2FHZ1_9TELE|nr:hypothetical protein EYF80_049302 [Liparis tanakae]